MDTASKREGRSPFLVICVGLLLAPHWALAHGGRPQVTGFVFPPGPGAIVWALTDTQGLFAQGDPEARWLCEDAVAPGAGIADIAVVTADRARWLLRTDLGVFVTDDGGCTFSQPPASLQGQTVTALSMHPERPREVLAATGTFDALNDIYRSDDAGRTWRRTGLGRRGRFLQLLRSRADPARVYARHDGGVFTSEDGGASWAPVAIAAPGVEVQAGALRLLAAPAAPVGRLFLAVEQVPETIVLATDDAGQGWREVLRVPDFDLGAVWELRNLGWGDSAARDAASSRVEQARYQETRILDRIAREIVESRAQVRSRRQQIETAQSAIELARQAYQSDRLRIKEGQGLPLEVLQSLQALDRAQREYLHSVARYNTSQFRLHHAIGWPSEVSAQHFRDSLSQSRQERGARR